jgi:ATP-dependent Clp protease ATP-binding subunit ClpA
MFERFTEPAHQVVVLAQAEARTLRHNYIGTEHLLLGLLGEKEGPAARVLESLDVTLERARHRVVQIVGSGEEVTAGQIPFKPRAKKVLGLALNEALSLGHNYIGTEHILLGIVRENEGAAIQILLDFHADSEKVRTAVIRMLTGPAARQRGDLQPDSWGLREPIDPSWFDGVSPLLDRLVDEIRRELKREPDAGDLLVALASVPDTLAGRALRDLGADLQALTDAVERLRDQTLADDQLAQQLDAITGGREQAIENLARLRAQERELREQAEARTAIGPEALQNIRRPLGLSLQAETPPHQPHDS